MTQTAIILAGENRTIRLQGGPCDGEEYASQTGSGDAVGDSLYMQSPLAGIMYRFSRDDGAFRVFTYCGPMTTEEPE
jgi:hypothetical protein